MRKLILSTNITLDGFMAGPDGGLDWHFQHWNDEMGAYSMEQINAVDTILVGRATYEGMANHWPAVAVNLASEPCEIKFANKMNSLPKIVFSTTLSAVQWNNSKLVKTNMVEEVVKLKQQPGRDMIMWGGVGIVATFMQLRLIDEYRIFIAPVVIGSGMRFGKDHDRNLDLKLLSTKIFSNGVVLLCYEPA